MDLNLALSVKTTLRSTGCVEKLLGELGLMNLWINQDTYNITFKTIQQFIQTYTYSTSSQHKLYNEICHVSLHICEIKNEQISVSLTETIDKKDILHTHWLTLDSHGIQI